MAPRLSATQILQSSAPAPEHSEVFEFAGKAGSLNTQRAYSADWRHFLAWCNKRNCPALPARPDDVALYLQFCATKLNNKISTVNRRLAAIAEAHRRLRHQSPTDEWIVRNTMRRLRRELDEPAKERSPILLDDLKRMIAKCPPTLQGTRDKALLLIGFCGALRRSQLVNLDIENITSAKEGLVLSIRSVKTSQRRSIRKIAIPFGKDPNTCPVKALLDWIDAAQIVSGPVFRAVTKWNRPRDTRLSDRIVAEVVKRYCRLIGKRASHFAAHSLRAGLAVSAAMAGATAAEIQRQTGHTSLAMLRRYIEDADIFRGNAVRKLNL